MSNGDEAITPEPLPPVGSGVDDDFAACELEDDEVLTPIGTRELVTVLNVVESCWFEGDARGSGYELVDTGGGGGGGGALELGLGETEFADIQNEGAGSCAEGCTVGFVACGAVWTVGLSGGGLSTDGGGGGGGAMTGVSTAGASVVEAGLVPTGLAAGSEGVGLGVDNCGGADPGDERTELIGTTEGALDGAALAIADGAIDSGTRSGGI